MYTIKLGKEELEKIEILLAKEIKSREDSLVIIEKIFSGKTCTCFCKMHGGRPLKIEAGAELYFVSRFVLNPRFENGKGSLLTIPENSEERRIPVGDLSESEILLLAAPQENGRGSFSFGCLDGKGKVEITSPLEVAFMLSGEWEDHIELVGGRGRKNYYRKVHI